MMELSQKTTLGVMIFNGLPIFRRQVIGWRTVSSSASITYVISEQIIDRFSQTATLRINDGQNVGVERDMIIKPTFVLIGQLDSRA